jgi:hypothetical protein
LRIGSRRGEIIGGFKKFAMKSLIVFLFAKYRYSCKIKEDEASGVCSTDGKDKR